MQDKNSFSIAKYKTLFTKKKHSESTSERASADRGSLSAQALTWVKLVRACVMPLHQVFHANWMPGFDIHHPTLQTHTATEQRVNSHQTVHRANVHAGRNHHKQLETN